ncbi:unnamed protein product [Clonostachys solani]|uniref:Uncharacterized protein n=1 Tax=Clonostachys solani TaxID=160281 RepID=A0A9N9ZC38_9HYPO|nr:unnamed protein product [Clonostachys solani]
MGGLLLTGYPRLAQGITGQTALWIVEPFMRLITRQNKYPLGIGYSLPCLVTAAVLPFGF